jgi:hypothetical protein
MAQFRRNGAAIDAQGKAIRLLAGRAHLPMLANREAPRELMLESLIAAAGRKPHDRRSDANA